MYTMIFFNICWTKEVVTKFDCIFTVQRWLLCSELAAALNKEQGLRVETRNTAHMFGTLLFCHRFRNYVEWKFWSKTNRRVKTDMLTWIWFGVFLSSSNISVEILFFFLLFPVSLTRIFTLVIKLKVTKKHLNFGEDNKSGHGRVSWHILLIMCSLVSFAV